MSSAVERYKQLLSGALTRYFPRTMAYLQAERAAARPEHAATPRKKPAASRSPGATAKKPGKARKPASGGIYGPEPLAVDEAMVQAMRQRVQQAVAAGVVSAPSEEQWAMILGRSPLTRIFAGAGSGKSSTLVLRVVFMLCQLQIDPARLTLISFTNASCAELRERLLKVLAFWQYPFDAAQAKHCVRTFHSAMGLQARGLLQDPQWFELLNDKRASTEELDTPLTSRLGAAQQRLLKQAYQQCYAQDAGFRDRVQRLLGLPPLPVTEGKPIAVPKAPMDTYKLPGEFKALPLFEAFYVQAGFMQSIGLRLDQLRPQALKGGESERCFIEALLPFWSTFEALLQAQGLLTFNGAFQRLTQSLGEGTAAISPAAITPLSHLLIDEFQDISPQIVQWLQAVHRALVRQGETVSLMAVGDDWQSIYGWRGSSPELFMDFDKYFPGRGRSKKSTVLTLATNYRSIEPLIRDGEAVLAGVQVKQDKLSQASKAVQPGDHGVKLVQRFDLKARMPDLLAEIQAQCEHVASRPQADRTAVLVLSRGNEVLRSVQAQLDKKWPVKTYTIHRAKGLQAEVAIILDDCLPPEPHPLRNLLYAQSGFFRNSYDQAMQDESLRLAYVAITRGVSRVLWFTRKTQGATQLLAARRG